MLNLKNTVAALSRLARLGVSGSDIAARVLRAVVWPKVDLLIRLWLAKIFFVSGLLKLTHWETAVDLAAHEYPVSFMSPLSAAYVGVSIEVGGAALLALGLATRYAAVPMLILSLVIQFAYMPFDSQLFWAALFGWYAVRGAGPISMDALLRRGLADSALPGVPGILQVSEALRAHVSPVYLSLVRIWLGAALLVAASRVSLPAGIDLTALGQWLPIDIATRVPNEVALFGGSLLLLGLGTRYLAVIMIFALFGDAMMDPRETDAVYLLMVFSIVIVYGGGPLSADRLLHGLLRAPRASARDADGLQGPPRVVIVGAGFGGISCAAALRHANVAMTIIDRTNYHLFQPLLYQVATASLSPGDIAAPVRQIFRDHAGIQVFLGTVSEIDTQAQLVVFEGRKIPYDYLVLATGATHSYFGKDAWSHYAPGLKRIEDATAIRRKILMAFERAEASNDTVERASLLTFLIVGGGPTGVELAGAIAELARFGLEKDFRHINPADARVVLVQSAPRILPTFPQSLAAVALRSLEKLGVEVLLDSRVDTIDADGVAVGGMRIAAKTVIWAAGVRASAAAQWLRADADSAGRIKVNSDLTVPGLANVYAIGDTALSLAWRGSVVPGLAPAAKQSGKYVARHIMAKVASRPAPEAFNYRHLGSLATIGRRAAVVDFGFIKLWGAPAWWLWGIIHIGFLAGVRNRISTMLNWFWSYLTFGGGIRLITGEGSTRDN